MDHDPEFIWVSHHGSLKLFRCVITSLERIRGTTFTLGGKTLGEEAEYEE
jgi:hypothetical protein